MSYKYEDGYQTGVPVDVTGMTILPGIEIKRFATTFEAAATFTLKRISLPMVFKFGSKATITSIWTEVWTVDANNTPLAKLGQSTNSVTGDDIGLGLDGRTEFDYAGVSIVAGTRYAVIADMNCAAYDDINWQGTLSTVAGIYNTAWIEEDPTPPGYTGWSDIPSVQGAAPHVWMYSIFVPVPYYYVVTQTNAFGVESEFSNSANVNILNYPTLRNTDD